MTSSKPTPNPRGHRPLEGVGTRMGRLAHATPTGQDGTRLRQDRARDLPASALIPVSAAVRPAHNTAYVDRRTGCGAPLRRGAHPAPSLGPRVWPTPVLR